MAKSKTSFEFELLKGKDTITPALRNVGAKVETAANDILSLKTAFKGVAVAAAAALAGFYAGSKFVDAANAQEDAINDLNAALKRSGDFSKKTSQELQNFASELQKTSKFGDEAVLGQLAFAQSMGATTAQSKTVLKASADLAAALNIDLNSATRNVAKTLGGFAGELGEVIPELKDLTQEQLRAGDAIDIIAAKYAGAARAQIDTFSGATTQLKNTFGDLTEEIGFTITQNPLVIKAIKLLEDGFSRLGGYVKDNRNAIIDWSTSLVLEAADAFKILITGVGDVQNRFATFEAYLTVATNEAVKFLNSIAVEYYKLSSDIESALAVIPNFISVTTNSALQFINDIAIGYYETVKDVKNALDDMIPENPIVRSLLGFGEPGQVDNSAIDAKIEALKEQNRVLEEGSILEGKRANAAQEGLDLSSSEARIAALKEENELLETSSNLALQDLAPILEANEAKTNSYLEYVEKFKQGTAEIIAANKAARMSGEGEDEDDGKDEKKVEKEKERILGLNAWKFEQKLIEKERNDELEAERKLEKELEDEEDFQLLKDNLGRKEALRIAMERQRDINAAKTDKDRAKIRAKYNKNIEKAEANRIFTIKAWEDQTNKERLDNFKGTLQNITALSQSNNKTLFAVGKAASISIATIDGFQAVQKALGSAPPPFNFALAAAVGAASAINIQKIASAKPPAMKQGGLIPAGFPNDTFAANLTSGEYVIDRDLTSKLDSFLKEKQEQPQSNLVNDIVERVLSQPIVVNVDGYEIARAVRGQVDQGFAI